MSAGSRSAVHWIRANGPSIERASARASAVLPTPGESSIRTWPSAARATSTDRRTSASTSTALATLSARRRPTAAAASSSCGARPSRRSGGSMLQVVLPAGPLLLHRVENRARYLGLRRPRHRPLVAGRDDRHLVLGGVEADVGSRDVVDDDQVQVLAVELFAAQRDRVLAVLGGKADERLPGPARGGQRRQGVLGALELEIELGRRLLLELRL